MRRRWKPMRRCARLCGGTRARVTRNFCAGFHLLEVLGSVLQAASRPCQNLVVRCESLLKVVKGIGTASVVWRFCPAVSIVYNFPQTCRNFVLESCKTLILRLEPEGVFT